MCGIAGVVGLEGGGDVRAVEEMLDVLYLRGPDDLGISDRPRVAIGARRLSIIDLETGHQPISNEDGSIHAALNGELYSHIELRAELIALGHRFSTRCDTEILVHGYEEWGIEGLLGRINGMFAFAIHDERSDTVYLARDRLGIKPLVYARRAGLLLFASTIHALLASGYVSADPDPLGVRLCLQQQFVPGARTCIAGVDKLPPASYLEVRDGCINGPTRYWKLPERQEYRRSPDEWHDLFRTLLDDAVRRRVIADVGVGLFLSGGVDSSIILGIMARHSAQPIHAFSVRFDGQGAFDESRFARAAAERFGATLHSIALDPTQCIEDLDNAVGALGLPIGDPAYFPTYFLSQAARRHVKVVLTGDGADEIFSGYGYYRHAATRMARALMFCKRLARHRAVASSGYPYVMQSAGVEALTPGLAGARELDATVLGLESQWAGNAVDDPLNRAARIDIGGWLVDDILMKVDSASMSHSLEARMPFLDHRVVELAITVPGQLKRRGPAGKVLLRDAFGHVLGPLLADRDKHGFSLPLAQWFRGPLRPLLARTLDRLPNVPWLDRSLVEGIVSSHLAGRDRSRALWNLYVLVTWFDAAVSRRSVPMHFLARRQ